MMTRRTHRLAVLAVLAALLLSLGNAQAADPLYNPIQNASTTYPYYSYGSQLSFNVAQLDKQATIKTYDMKIPSGWHIAYSSIDPSTQATCSTVTQANAERVGPTKITLTNDDVRGSAAPLTYLGFLYYLNHNTVTSTSTFCGLVSTSSSLIPAANRSIIFELLLTRNGDGSGNLTWDYTAVTGAAPGTNSIFDNTYYSGQNTSITFASVQLKDKTDGNYHTLPNGAKSTVNFVWNPDTIGTYTFTGTYTQCATGESSYCVATPGSVTRNTGINITNYPVGYHPGPKLTGPAFWSVHTGSPTTTFTWTQPSTVSSDKIKGYALYFYGDAAKTTQNKSLYLITDPTNPGVTVPNPCGTDGVDASCSHTIDWTTILTDGGQPFNANATFSASLVAIYQDLHRSDGRCDDGSITGYYPPCADGTTPQYDSLYQTGTTYTQFLHRSAVWPLRYRKTIATSESRDPSISMYQVYVLLADLEAKKFEYVVWKPAGNAYTGAGLTINGTNAAGGEIAFAVTTGPQHWVITAVLGPSDARGVWALTSSTNQLQAADRFDGCPLPNAPPNPNVPGRWPCWQSHAMTKV